MRHFYTLLAAVLAIAAAPAGAQWTTQSPVPTDLDVRGVAAPTAGRVFVATEDDSFDDSGALFESQDGGATWVQRNVPFGGFNPLNGLFFLDSQRGWVFGNETYRTLDGGTTWEELPFLGSTYFMRFHTPTFGFAAGNGGLYVSRDGGLSWVESPDGMFSFDFVSETVGLGAGPAGISRSVDGGATFALVHAGSASAVAFLSASVAVGIVDSMFVRSTDGGVTWTAGQPAAGYVRLLPAGGDVVVAWRHSTFPGGTETIARSADGGVTWTESAPVVAGGIFAMTLAAPGTLVAASPDGHMHRSIDGGATWALTYSSPGPRPSFLSSAEPSFPDAQTGYFGYGAGFVIKTTDGGASWTQISSGHGASLNDIDRFADGSMIAVGGAGTVLRSDGGGRWIFEAALTTRDLVAVDVIQGQQVVVSDEDGRVYFSADGGAGWTPAPTTPAFFHAEDVRFTTLLDGWVVGNASGGSSLYGTTDGGASWTPVDGVPGLYVAIDFEGTSGWTVNIGGPLRRTVDGGATWTPGALPDTEFSGITDIDFFDANVGYAVGTRGYAVRSADGGVTWDVLPTPTEEHDFTDIYLLGPNELWLSTRDDVAYYSATAGQNWAVIEIGSEGFGSFEAIAASAAGAAWTVGYQGYIEHFPGPPPPPLNRPPEASFTFLPNRLVVSFTDTSTDPDGTIVSYAWEFGDGATSTERHPTHTYAAANTYLVRLTVTDDDGATDVAGAAIVVQQGPGGTFGDFTEVTPFENPFVTPQDEDFWVATTAPADYDMDGDLDVAVLGYYVVYNQSVDERLVLFRNGGQAAPDEWNFDYIEVPLGGITSGASDLAWGDVDGDGDQDLVVGSDGETVIYRNDAGTLTITDTVLPGYYEDNDQADFDLRSISWADFDNDGDPDLLIPSVFDFDTFEYRTALMRNDGPNGTGGWTFVEMQAGLPATRHAQSAWADHDGDGDLDLLFVDMVPLSDSASFVRIYRNDGGTFVVEAEPLGGTVIEHGEAQWGDYDADGDLDILVAGHIREPGGTFDRVLRVYRNDAGTHVPFEVIPDPPSQGWFDLTAGSWGDYDSDGDIDILLTGTYNDGSQISGRAKIYVNDGGTFTDSGNDLPAPRAGGTRGGTFSWFDLDIDGDLDYFIAGDYWVPGGNGLIESQIHAYRNDVGGTNAAPTPPTNLAATVSGQGVTLNWAAATDDSTPVAALTYDLDLRLMGAPVATPARLPEPGDVSAVTTWALAGLPDGTYQWTVRAVDSALNPGAVAEGSFTVGPVANEPGAGLPAQYALEAVYPNPFTTTATVRYALPEEADVVVVVYDVLGRQVAHLVDAAQPAGYHEVQWDGAGAAVGTYVVRFSTESFAASRRVTLVR